MAKTKGMQMLIAVLALVGGVNWVLVGAFSFDLVQQLLGSWEVVARVVYVAAGAAGAWIAAKMLM